MNIQTRHITNLSACMNRLIPTLFLALTLALPITGCGNKTMPRPITHEPPPQVKDLQVKVRPKGVEVSWTIPEEIRSVSQKSNLRFLLLKSQVKWENRNCLDCPTANQQEVLNISPSYPEPAYIENNRIVWLDIVVSKQHAYRYQVAIQEKRGRPLKFSSAVIAKVVPAPLPVRDLQVNTDQQGIMIQWKASNKDEHGQPLQGDLQFIIERQAPGGSWEKVSPISIRANAYLDKTVASDQLYDYRVTPQLVFEGTSVVGETSATRQAKAPGAVPPPPPKTVWVIPSKSTLEVHWTESEGKTAGYHVYRREGKEITRLTSSPIQKAPYVDHAVRRNVIYYYAVSAVDTAPDQQEGLLSKWVEIRSLLFE